jgi:hypothetical protein
VLIEALGDDEKKLWLGRTVPFGGFYMSSKKRPGQQASKYETRFNCGEYLIAVKWNGRLRKSGDGQRLEFLMGERQVDVIINTELRLAGFDMA